MTDTDSTPALPSSGRLSPQARQSLLILLVAILGMGLALLLGDSFGAPFCWLGLPFLIFGSTAFRHLPHLRKRWKALLVLLYALLGTSGLLLLSFVVMFKNIH